ncbi:MAG: RHS repeat-associated core domain-containing protein, partial [Bacteroidales bacterium]|nr:RHS repeat-associated core domain-containing protein [Bacteroidales bacterium]
VNERSSVENHDMPYKYTGKEYDPETKLTYYGARYYDAKLSRWISVDPPLISGAYLGNDPSKLPGMGGVFNPINLDAYQYGGMNPVKYVDADGNFIIETALLIDYVYLRIAAYAMENLANGQDAKTTGYAIQHPYNAYKTGTVGMQNSISNNVSNFQINICRTADMPTGQEGDYGNAFRHVMWQAMITKKFGDKHANRMGNAHENYIDRRDTNQRVFRGTRLGDADTVADLLNNQIGIDIGNNNKSASNVDIAKSVLKEFHENGYWTASQKGDNIVLERTKLTGAQYKAGIREASRLKADGLRR